jgi:hypothetical protein
MVVEVEGVEHEEATMVEGVMEQHSNSALVLVAQTLQFRHQGLLTDSQQ